MKLSIKVKQIKGQCPVYQVGDEFWLEQGYILKLPASRGICMHSLASIMPYYVALSRGVKPKDLGLAQADDDCAYLQCLDPCEYTGGGTVVFEVKCLGTHKAPGQT